MQKLTRALNDTLTARLPEDARADFTAYRHKQLFTYAKDHDDAWTDPNEPLIPDC